MPRIPLIRRRSLYVAAVGKVCTERFVQVFRSTWRRLPAVDKRTILAHWRSAPLPPGYCPRIELLTDWSNRYHNEPEGALAQCTARGRNLYFWSPAVERLPAELGQTLIAHELMHVWLWAEGRNDEATDEDKVREYVFQDWWFDEDQLDEWIESHRELLRSLRQGDLGAN